MNIKPCSTPSCPYKRLGQRKYCYRCLTAKEREKRLQRANKALQRKVKSKGYQRSETRKWHRKCWALMSEWVRRKDADWRGYAKCFTCDQEFHWKNLQAGHRYHRRLDFDERNIAPQCWTCNGKQARGGKSGNLGEYEHRLVLKHGIDWCAVLRLDANTHLGYSLESLKFIHADLTKKLSELP